MLGRHVQIAIDNFKQLHEELNHANAPTDPILLGYGPEGQHVCFAKCRPTSRRDHSDHEAALKELLSIIFVGHLQEIVFMADTWFTMRDTDGQPISQSKDKLSAINMMYATRENPQVITTWSFPYIQDKERKLYWVKFPSFEAVENKGAAGLVPDLIRGYFTEGKEAPFTLTQLVNELNHRGHDVSLAPGISDYEIH